MDKFGAVIQWSDEDSGYIAYVPELEGASAFGETPGEALAELEDAKQALLEVYKEDGCDLPEPQKLKQYSGQTRLRIPKSLHAKLSHDAKIEGVSLNTYIVNILSENSQESALLKEISTIKKMLSRFYFDYPFQQGAEIETQDQSSFILKSFTEEVQRYGQVS